MDVNHTISCSADVKIHDLKSVVSPVNLPDKGSNNSIISFKNSM